MSSDVVIIGGGVIGLTLAYKLAEEGVSTTIIERGEPGREASWAGAGMLPPGNFEKAKTPAALLRGLSDSLWSDLSNELLERTGVDNGYRNSGGMEVRYQSDESLSNEIEKWKLEEVPIEILDRKQLKQKEPLLSEKLTKAYFLPTMHQVRNPRQLSALYAGCQSRGVQFLLGQPVTNIKREGEKVLGVETLNGSINCGHVCIATGSWSGQLLNSLEINNSIKPVRGQIVLLRSQQHSLKHIIQIGSQYLVPRPDGRILIGSTMENVGFNKTTTASGISSLIQFALELVPELASATVEKTWAGLRPGSEDGLPYLGEVGNYQNLSIAAGHFRDGLQLSPATAILMTQHIMGIESAIPIKPYSLERG